MTTRRAWLKRAFVTAGVALLLCIAWYFGPQVLRRSGDWITKPDAPPKSAHWIEQTAHFVEAEIEDEYRMYSFWYWTHPESTEPSEVDLAIDEDVPFEFEWSWSRHPSVIQSIEIHADGRSRYWASDKYVPEGRSAAEVWPYIGAEVTFTITPDERRQLARQLTQLGFGSMPKQYWLTGTYDGWWWRFAIKQNGKAKYVRCDNLFPRDCRKLAAYLLRTFALPRAAEVDAAGAEAAIRREAERRARGE